VKGEERKKEKPAGKIGARRARSSKLASMRRISPSRASSFSTQPEDVSFTRMLETLKPHDHLCLIYESKEEWRAAVVPFMSIGLKRGERCIYIVDTSTADGIRKYLAEEGVDVASAEKSGQLSILHETEAYTSEGSFDPDKMIALLISETEKAIAEGYLALRVTGEMTWVLRGHPGSERLLEYEAKLNRDFFPKYLCLAICQYDRWKFDPEIVKGVIMTHPLLVRGNKVYQNFYYIPAEKFLNLKRAEIEVQHWLNNVEREWRIQETLRSSEYEKVTVLAAMLDIVIYQDLEHRVVWANKAAGESVGLAPEGLIGRYCYEIWQQRSLPCVNCPVAQARETSKPQQNEVSSPDGRLWLVRGYPVIGPDGVVSGAIEVTQDITERKRVEEALRQSEEKYRTILSEMQDSYFEVDLAGNLTFFNDSTSNSLGYSAEELMGVSYREFTASEDIKLVYKVFNKVYRTNRPNKGFLWKVVRKDGAVGFVEATVSPLRNPKGEIIGFRGVGRDITERKRAEEERGQFEQKAQIASRLASVGEMAAGIAHEINNPLTSVIGYSQLLSGREDIPEDVKMDLKAIDEGAQRVAGIIKRLLTFARQSRPERTLVSINDLITNTLDLRAYHLRTNNIKVTAKLATDLPLTTADPAQLQQVFLNIIVNAEAEMRQARGRGRLLVKTEEVNGTIRISFKDNGPGIAKKNLARIFDPFFTTREVDQGTGLGLSICHGIIAEHKGRIWAESKPGRGATFIVELPIVMGSRQLEMAEPPGKKLKKVPKAKILVVDDETSTLEFLSRLLTDEGHDVETVSNADEALEMVKNKRYSLILLDIKMPGASGIELYGRMQKIALSLAERVIFITGDVMGTDTEAFLSKTKAPYIAKPFDVHQLKKKIERFLTGD
jgi:PAS domain S-box-containing protein